MRGLLVFWVFLFAVLLAGEGVAQEALYTVKEGDSLSRIARRLNTTVKALKEANRPTSPTSDIIKPGDKLKIPGSGGTAAPPDKSLESPSSPAPSEAIPEYHTVKKGETLSGIAKKYQIPLGKLRELNGLAGNSATIKAGERLVVRQTPSATRQYTVKRGDSLIGIARRFNKTPAELKALNGLGGSDKNILKPGQRLLLEPPPEELQGPPPPESLQAKVEETLAELSTSPEIRESGVKERLLLVAKGMLDVPYRFGGSTFYGIDCSAFVQKVFNFLNIPLPRTAREQFHKGITVGVDELSAGDLLFFKTYASFPSHVGIYIGENLFIHASSRGRKVTVDSLETPYYSKRFIGAKRLLEGGTPKEQGESVMQ